jgi:release factor glutamine methyltransferase
LERVRFVQGDLGEPLTALGPFDCIVANLPYVPTSEVPACPDPVGHEPLIAVDGGVDGLTPYRRLVEQLPKLAAPGATLLFEAAPGTIPLLAEVIEKRCPGAQIEIGEDFAGFERFVRATLRG